LFCGFWLFAALWTLSESPNEKKLSHGCGRRKWQRIAAH
jgi:hypothetical protein